MTQGSGLPDGSASPSDASPSGGSAAPGGAATPASTSAADVSPTSTSSLAADVSTPRTPIVFQTKIAPEWIDYNAHLRDAYYTLIFSLATDALMDRIGLDEAYRKRTRNTLYTLEMHIHYLHEVKDTDVVDVAARILGTDRKRIHAAFDMYCARYPDPVSTAEMMLLHVHQGDEVKSQAFPPEVIEGLANVASDGSAHLADDTAREPPHRSDGSANPGASGAVQHPAAIPGSRRMELRSCP